MTELRLDPLTGYTPFPGPVVLLILDGVGLGRRDESDGVFLAYTPAPRRQTDFDIGPASAFGLNTRTYLMQIPALLIRDQQGYTALSLVCTHLGCTVEQSPEGFACPCHGSRYDDQGAVERGPATAPLRRLRTEISTDGKLIVHTD